jgi:paraquat-inducible protein A
VLKPNSIARTWALVLAAIILYIPANVLPITVVISLGKAQADTIMSGVIYFLHTGMWPIGLIIFLASIFIPMLKLLALIFLLISVQRKSSWRQQDRTRLYRIGGPGASGRSGNHSCRSRSAFFRRGGGDHHIRGHEF